MTPEGERIEQLRQTLIRAARIVGGVPSETVSDNFLARVPGWMDDEINNLRRRRNAEVMHHEDFVQRLASILGLPKDEVTESQIIAVLEDLKGITK